MNVLLAMLNVQAATPNQTPGPARPGDLANTPTAIREAQIPWPGAPPQDQGLPYTNTAREYGLAAISNDIAVFAGSRYAYANGYKIRLDDAQLLGGDAVMRDGKVYVPAAFAGVLALQTIKPAPAPAYLADRWVYTLDRPATTIPAGVEKIYVDGHVYLDLVALANALGYKSYQNSRGLVLLSKGEITFDDQNQTLVDDVVTMFDTPEKLMDPSLVAKYIPRLVMQGQWSDRVNFTPEQAKLLDGPATKWPEVPQSSYDLAGFNAKLLGSKVPPPGVYPRLLFSPEDVPVIYARMKSQKVGQKTLAEWNHLFNTTWWDPKTDDGKVFQKLVTGQIDQLAFIDPQPGRIDPLAYTFKGQTPGIYNAYVNYTTNSLTSMALYCLLTGDDEHGKQTAAAIISYYKKIAPLLDRIYAMSDSEFGTNSYMAKFSETGARGMRLVISHMDVAFALDFAGKWMTADQKDFMRHLIAEATYGRRDDMQAAPDRLRDGVNTTWYLTNFIAATAIEGLEGCDPELIQMGRDTARDFLDWGIDDHGFMFEGNGTSTFGFQFELLSMIILARRGDNLWGHPHLRQLLATQAESMSPDGWSVLSSGRFGASPFSFQAADEIKAFYPDNLAADWILAHTKYEFDPVSPFDAAAFQHAIDAHASRIRLPGPTYPGSAFGGIYDTDWDPLVTRDKLAEPLTFNDPTYGFLSSYSDNTANAAWLALHVRANQYLGSGQFHSDVGMFYFSSAGVNWITEANFTTESSGKYHNLVLIANRGEPEDIPARGDYLGGTVTGQAAFGTVDQKNSYSYEWRNQVELWEDNDPTLPASASTEKWELETDPVAVAAYKGTQNYKSRAWYASYTITNWIPVVRRPFNPVQYAFRTAGLVRGPHPYGLVVDDIKKDDQSHLYQWTAILGANITQTKLPKQDPNQLFLIRSTDLDGSTPKPGSPLLMVYNIPAAGNAAPRADAMKDGPINRYDLHDRYNRVTIDQRTDHARYRVLLIPCQLGDDLPQITYDPKTDQATLHWANQEDTVHFIPNPADNRTRFTIQRGGADVLNVK
ncbi:MAG TPA: hypothetical protein VHC95_04600 [Opitutales bacterium]|nr:hypothetical protein [Opitutales bacterium]